MLTTKWICVEDGCVGCCMTKAKNVSVTHHGLNVQLV